LGAVHKAANKLAGEADIPTSIAIAQLALKHRQNKNLRQRIVVLLASPLSGAGADERGMIRLAKKLKKNNVAVDIVAFGDAVEEDAGATNVLRAFVDNANSGDNSLRAISSTYSCASFAHQPPLVLLYRRLLNVPPGAHLLSEAIMRSPILASDLGIPEGLGNEGGPSGAGGAGGQEFEFGVDPSIDPELAMVCVDNVSIPSVF
jgi:26S proteasome regulatory subunit N10